MKLFTREGEWNWVDANNVVLGFRNDIECCENFGFNYSHTVPSCAADVDALEAMAPEPDLLDQYFFDTSFFRDLSARTDTGGVVFRLVADSRPDLYLILFNHHNGYYSHGFSLFDEGVEVVASEL